MELALFFLHGTLLLLFGVFLSGAFAGVSFQIKKNIFLFLGISGLLRRIRSAFLFLPRRGFRLGAIPNQHSPAAVFAAVACLPQTTGHRRRCGTNGVFILSTGKVVRRVSQYPHRQFHH